MKLYELLIEAIIKTELGPIFRAQNRSQIESGLIKSEWRELRAVILPNQLWFVDSSHMIHYEMARRLKDHFYEKIDLTDGAGVFIRDGSGTEYPVKDKHGIYNPSTTNKPIQGKLILTGADYGYDNYKKIGNYPIVKRLGFITISK